MLYNSILEIEKQHPDFNRDGFSSRQLIDFVKDNFKIHCIKDLSSTYAYIVKYKDKRYIFYNPQQAETNLVLSLGHEVGHVLLNHNLNKEITPFNMFAKNGDEKDAGIVGFLFWLPTPELERIKRYGELCIEELYNYVSNCDMTHDEAYKICNGRLRILKALERKYPINKNKV
ncbi:MAG: ImmA/IrrE family metallo-endopeptidase [Desulfobacterales bacterium]|nr:ImmA/IrrE family metallo-endopeptidase [Desulfobacterales bacterium]